MTPVEYAALAALLLALCYVALRVVVAYGIGAWPPWRGWRS